MLKTLLICTALVGTPALAQMNGTTGMDGAMAGMDGSNQTQMMDQNSGAGGMQMGANGDMMPMMGMMMQMMQMMMGQMQGMGGAQGMGSGMGSGSGMGDTQQGMGQMQGMQGMDQTGTNSPGGMGQMGAENGGGGMQMGASSGMVQMMQGMMGNKMGARSGIGGSPLSEPGQSAFAAIAEVVRQLKSNPDTDWSSVDINALRQHLRDMDVVTIDSTTVAENIDGGVRFTVTGAPDVAPSITRMVLSHAQVMDGVDGWAYSAEALDNGAAISITVPEADLPMLKALGFYGMLAAGPHHQPHHWAMANGKNMMAQ